MENRTQVTAKQLDFIDNVDLRAALLERLVELDRVFLVNANYSTVFVAIGAIEGVFRHVADIYRAEIQASSTYPTTKGKKPKRFQYLTIDELYIELKNLGIVPDIPEYKQLYHLFRNYRNCIHPQAQVRKGWKIELGQAQMALGLLNATIQNLDRNVFVDKHIFEKVAGSPQYDSQRVLHLQREHTPHHSFIVLREPLVSRLRFTFEVDMSPDALLNFVFDYVDDGDFRMLRLDSRRPDRCPNAVLRSTQKYLWQEVLWATPRKLPEKESFPVEIEIDIPGKVFRLVADGVTYSFEDAGKNQKDLFGQLQPGKRVGFFNEVNSVRLLDVRIDS